MLKYLSIIALGSSCLFLSANAEDFTPTRYTFDYDAFNKGPAPTPSVTSYTGQAYSVTGTASPIDFTISWDGVNSKKNGASSIEFLRPTDDMDKLGSTVTVNFGNYIITDLTFTISGLNGRVNNDWNAPGGKFEIQGLKDDTNIEDNFLNLGHLTSGSGHGYYERQRGHNMNSTPMATVTITESVTQFSLYFESRGYEISGMSFTVIGYSPVPEPATYAAIIGFGIAGVALLRRRRKA